MQRAILQRNFEQFATLAMQVRLPFFSFVGHLMSHCLLLLRIVISFMPSALIRILPLYIFILLRTK